MNRNAIPRKVKQTYGSRLSNSRVPMGLFLIDKEGVPKLSCVKTENARFDDWAFDMPERLIGVYDNRSEIRSIVEDITFFLENYEETSDEDSQAKTA